jgi:hypothetical protein
LASLGVTSLGACSSDPPPPGLGGLIPNHPIVEPDSSRPLVDPGADLRQAEMSSTVLPAGANPSCPNGRVFLGYGTFGTSRSYSDDIEGAVHDTGYFNNYDIDHDFEQDDYRITTEHQSHQPGFDCQPLSTKQRTKRDFVAYTDSQLARVDRGSVVSVFLAAREHAPSHPVPAFDDLDGPVSCKNPFVTTSIVVAKTDDCGATWHRTKIFDINAPHNDFLGGKYMTPEYVDGVVQHGPGMYALDRPEIYADPMAHSYSLAGVTPLFMTAIVRMGPRSGTHLLFSSPDGGETWNDPVVVPGGTMHSATMITVSHFDPSGPGRVYLFRCDPVGGTTYEPMLYWSDDYGQTFPPEQALFARYIDPRAPDGFPCGTAGDSEHGGVKAPATMQVGIAQVGGPLSPNVVVTYPAVDPTTGLAVQLLVAVDFDSTTPVVRNYAIVDETSSGRSVTFAAMAPVDRFEYRPEQAFWSDPFALWWLSVGRDSGDVMARVLIGQADGIPAEPTELSRVGGRAQSWTWNLPSEGFVGDYDKGSFFYGRLSSKPGTPAMARFFLPWIQSDPSMNKYNSAVHGNLVSLPEPE